MHQPLYTGVTCASGKARGFVNMHRVKAVPAVLDIAADRIDGTVGVDDSPRHRHFILHVGRHSFGSRLVLLEQRWLCAGWRTATRTANPRPGRCRTIRRPRKPVPPNTVTDLRRSGMLWSTSSTMAVSETPDSGQGVKISRADEAEPPGVGPPAMT
jgi:hypothetical protein